MATENITEKNIIKSWFKRGLKPLEVQFHAWMDSYWHKSEDIPTSAIKGLETTLNKKAETTTVQEITQGLEKHINDSSAHKTEKEQSKLNHLADDPDATYAKKEEFQDIEPLVFTVTYTESESSRRYILSEEQKQSVVEYFLEGKSNPVILYATDLENAENYERYVMTFQKIYGIQRMMCFHRIGTPLKNTVGNVIYQIQMQFNLLPNGSYSVVSVVGRNINTSEYVGNRYIRIEDGYNMNSCTSSGGIYAISNETIQGKNIPEGFTSFHGYVLADSVGCTQVVTDDVLGKTVLRIKDEDGWTSWKEIGADPNKTIVFTATYSTVDGEKEYILDDGLFSDFASYFDLGKTNPVILSCRASDNTTPNTEIYTLEKLVCENTMRAMDFISIESHAITRIRLRGIKLSLGWTNSVDIYTQTYPFSESEYKYDRYVTSGSYDMNDMVESGGISGYIDSDIVGTNIPEGFTDFYGYVLRNYGGGYTKSRCCTQVVTDMILQKTMMRSSVPSEDYKSRVWTPWKEIGAPAPETIRFTATKTVSDTGAVSYAINKDQMNEFMSYFDKNKTNPVELQIIADNGDGMILQLNNTEIVGISRRMKFILREIESITTFQLQSAKLSSAGWSGFSLTTSTNPTEESEYKYDRYSPLDNYDMNNWTESGGIYAFSDDPSVEGAVVGTNIPEGFTNFFGYALKNSGYGMRSYGCTQVITDHMLKKTMLRSLTYPDDSRNGVWTPWREIGGSPEVYVVAEYPTDLSGYGDGSIFIKTTA